MRQHLPLRVVSYTHREHERYLSLPLLLRQFTDPWRLRHTLRQVASHQILLLRDFLTVPFMLAAPALLPYRRRLVLVSNHNLQRAHQSEFHRYALRTLAAAGFRFLSPESNVGWSEIGIDPKLHVSTAPLATGDEPFRLDRSGLRDHAVGLIGQPRAEKGARDMPRRLRAALDGVGQRSARILVGRPRASSPYEGEADPSISLVDTTARSDYLLALARCRVVVLDYAERSYAYRCSASILDAATAGTVVVCPFLPVINRQLNTPVAIGVEYGDRASFAETLAAGLRLAQERPDFERYLDFRYGDGVSTALTDLVAQLVARRSVLS